MRAIEDVLASLPAEHYETWKARGAEVVWFIPHHGLWGRVSEPPKKITIYLSPLLEFNVSDSAVVGLVAHEIAHFLLGHAKSELPWAQKEAAVNEAVREWGYANEADASDRELWAYFNPPMCEPPPTS
jgi:hypothetical protein